MVERSQHDDGRRARTMIAVGAGIAAGLLAVAAWRRRSSEPVISDYYGSSFDERRETIGGVRMRWLEHGQGTPVVLLHGIPTSPLLWRRVMPLLRHAKAYAWEMVGYGASMSEGEGRDISVGRQAEYLADWLRRRGLTKVVLAGHDLGGGVAQILASRHPELCGGLLLANSIAYDSWPIPEVKAMRAMGGAVEHMPSAGLRRALEMLLIRGHDDRRIRIESSRLHLSHYRGPGAARALTRQLQSLDVHDTLEVQEMLPHLKVPARVIWGMSDRFQKARYGSRLAHDLGTSLLPIEHGKHFTPEDHPHQIASALNDLLREAESEIERVQTA